MKPRMGRPPLPRDEVKQVFTLRLSAAERGRIEAAAKRDDMPASQWARKVLVAMTEAESPQPMNTHTERCKDA